MLAGVQAPAPYTLCGLVCYHALHYCAIVRDERRGRWLHCDDSSVTVLGADWHDVLHKCHSSKYQPSLVLYRRVANEAPRPLPLPAASANVGGNTWANMAVRGAAKGGSSESNARAPLALGGAAPAGAAPGGAPASAAANGPTGGTGGTNGSVRASRGGVPNAPARPLEGGTIPPPPPNKRGPGACHNCDDPSHESRDCPKPCRHCGSDKHRIGYHYRSGMKSSRCFNCQASLANVSYSTPSFISPLDETHAYSLCGTE